MKSRRCSIAGYQTPVSIPSMPGAVFDSNCKQPGFFPAMMKNPGVMAGVCIRIECAAHCAGGPEEASPPPLSALAAIWPCRAVKAPGESPTVSTCAQSGSHL